jgi:hypothetical protein
MWSMPAIAVVVLLTVAACKKDNGPPADKQFTSLLFDASSPAAREALATPVSFRLTESNYSQWEQAQRFLDALPRSAFASASGAGGSAIDRAVETLEASPRARTAIERTGLSVRDFVLETIALAQAAEARSGSFPRWCQRPARERSIRGGYQSRIMQARVARASVRDRVGAYDDKGDTTSVGLQPSADITPQVEEGAGVPSLDSVPRAEAGDPTDSIGAERQRSEQPKPRVDTVRDTIPEIG